MRTWPAAANDGFSDPPGMDARRARSDRDVARARGQKNRVSKGLRATKREAGARGEVPRIGAQGLAPHWLQLTTKARPRSG